MSEKLIYLDNAATTAVDGRVLDAMLPYFCEEYANPAGMYSFSAGARNAVEKARSQAAELIGADPQEIVFTSGGTESDNMALAGFTNIVTCGNEHPAILNTCKEAEKHGAKLSYVPSDPYGFADIDAVRQKAREGVQLISIMTANNELGCINDVGMIAEIAHEAGALFHTDAVQAAGHIPMDVKKNGTDMLSISSHKLHGPKGIGALFIRKGVKKEALIYGGGQEKGLRSGTLNVPAIVGFGEACRIAREEETISYTEMLRKKEYFADLLTGEIEGVRINSPKEKCLPSILSVSFERIESSSLMIELDMKGICCSAGSACSASSGKPSHVLTAAGLPADVIRGTLRFSFSRFTTDEELETTAAAVKECVARLRRLIV